MRGPLRDSERRKSEPGGEAPSSRPSPRVRGEGEARSTFRDAATLCARAPLERRIIAIARYRPDPRRTLCHATPHWCPAVALLEFRGSICWRFRLSFRWLWRRCSRPGRRRWRNPIRRLIPRRRRRTAARATTAASRCRRASAPPYSPTISAMSATWRWRRTACFTSTPGAAAITITIRRRPAAFCWRCRIPRATARPT